MEQLEDRIVLSTGAVFLGTDTATQGNWQGTYGANGYNVVGASASYPSYTQVNPSGQQTWIWSASTTDPRGLLKPGSTSDRVLACWYATTSFNVGVTVTDGGAHRVALYLLDASYLSRTERIDVLDASSGAVLDSRAVADFGGGEYLAWDVSGAVTFRLTNTSASAPNAVLSGLFFDPAPVAATITGAPASGHDPEGTAVTLSSQVTGGAGGYTYAWAVTKNGQLFASGTTASLSFTPDDTGTYVATLTATDQHGVGSNAATATITADDVAPTAAITGAPASGHSPVGTAITLGSQVTDPSTVDAAGGYTYAWSVTGPGGSTVATGSSASLTFTPAIAGTYVATLTATDDDPLTSAPVSTTIVADPRTSAGAVFLGTDTATQGNWQGTYGANGYNVVGASASYPSYTQVNPSGQQTWIWSASTTDPRGLLKPGSTSDRVLACWYATTSFNVGVTVTDGGAHRVALYLLDASYLSRTERIDVLDASSGAVLDSRAVADFGGGEYLAWDVSGAVTFRLTNTSASAPNAVLSGLFFDPAPSSFQVSAGSSASGTEGNAVSFSGSVQGGTGPYSYSWSFGDGTTDSGTLTPSHTYTKDGTYTVTLTVTDASNQSASATTTAMIAEGTLGVTINGAPAHSNPGTAIALTSTVTDPSGDTSFTYAWVVSKNGSTFATSTAASLTFTPDTSASYVVTLTAKDADGGSGTAQQTITVDTNTGNLLLPASELSALQQQAAQNTPEWQAFKSQLDAGLPQILGFSGGDAAYEGSELKYIMDYALGYQVLRTSDPLTAANYADKALAMMRSAITDRQEGMLFPLQFIARGNGSTTTFTIPNADYIPSSLQVWTGPVATKAVVRGSSNIDQVSSDQVFLKVSNTPDGPADYVEGVDWEPDPNQEDGNILWLPGGKQPAAGATYYVTMTNPGPGPGSTQLGASQYTVNGTTVTLNFTPTTSQSVWFAYIYGTHSANGSTLAYQQTGVGNGGFGNILIDTTYTSRNLGKYLALGLDWLDGYVGFSSSFKQQVESMLVKWFNYLTQNGYHYNDPGSNYGAGSYVSNMLTALALQKRDPVNGPVLVNAMLNYRNNILVPLLTRNPGDPQPGSTTPDPHGSLNGGFWAEGWNYGPLAIQNLLLGSLALEDSGTIAQATAERQWANQVIDNLISSTTDNGKSTYDGGDPLSWSPTFPNAQLFYVLASMASSSTEQSYANYILQNWNLPNADNAVKLLFDNPSAPAASWTSSLPLQDYAVGTGLVQARSDWGSTPVWASIEAANGIHADHQTAAPGTMDITRGADRLLVNGNAPGQQVSPPKSRNANVLIIDDNGDGVQETRYAEDDGLYYGSPGIVVNDYQATSAFTYFNVDLHAAYSNPLTPGQGGSASELTRQWVYLRPGYVVVFDRATTVKDTYTKEDRWHFTAAPTVSGNAFVETVGSSKLFGQAFSTLPLTTTVAPVQVGSATIEQMDVQNSTTSASVRYVTAFEATSSGTAAMDPTQHVLSTDQRMEGVQMGSDVVLFGRNGDVDLTTPVTYTFTGSASVQHLLTNLAAGANYQVTVNGTVLTTVTASAQGTITFTTTATGTATVQVAKV